MCYAQQDATRLEQIFKEDPGAISIRRVAERAGQPGQGAQPGAGRGGRPARAQEAAGESGDDNAQLISARSASRRPNWTCSAPRCVAPARGLVTDLRTDVGQFAQAGAPAMTLIAIHDLWISADMTENNLGNIEPGDEVAIVLDVMPGEVLEGPGAQRRQRGRLRAAGAARDPADDREQPRLAAPGAALPGGRRVRPVRAERLRAVRIGGQAEVLVYTGDHGLMNWLGAAFIRLMS